MVTNNPFLDPNHLIDFGLRGRDVTLNEPLVYERARSAGSIAPRGTSLSQGGGQSVRDLFEVLAAATWERLELSETLKCSQSEETITDLNLMEMVRAGLPALRVYKATRQEESVRGFDWEWWIGSDRDGWWRYSVQAKRLDLQSGRYLSLRHKVNGRWQIDLLSAFAFAQGSVPLYCFYNWAPPETCAPAWQCNLPRENAQLGCTVVPLDVARAAHEPRARKSFGALHRDRRALPWRCLVACPYITGRQRQEDWHPLANDNVRPRRYDRLPDFLADRDRLAGRHTSDSPLIEPPHELYRNELSAYPMRIAVVPIPE